MKPAYKTTEFWLSLLAILVSCVTASQLLAPQSAAAQVAGMIGAVLTALGYTGLRTAAKSSATAAGLQALAANDVEAADVHAVIASAHGAAPSSAALGSATLAAAFLGARSATTLLVVGLSASALGVTLTALAACGATAKSVERTAVSDVVACTAADRQAAEAQFGPIVEQLIQRATGADGKVDLPSLDAATRSLTKDGWCVVETVTAQLIAAASRAILPGAPAAAPAAFDPADLAAKVAQLRVARFGSTRFELAAPGGR